jgi:tetratricopeptide (TPR) repeat protein
LSRSIHETRRQLEETRRWEFGPGILHEEETWLVQDRLSAKRRYKNRASRSRTRTPIIDSPAEVAVITEPEVEHLHHPLSEEDIRGLLATVPADVRPYVHAIHRRNGLREDDMWADNTGPDPLTGRHGYQLHSGIWAPRLAGRFRPRVAEIDLFGFVYDDRTLRVPEVQTALLWLTQAMTLLHEVAHAWDEWARSDSDRWAPDEQERERYADAAAQVWTKEHAVAFFELHHPERTNAYEQWILEHLGITIQLVRVADDLDRSVWGAHIALGELAAEWNDAEALDLRVGLAEDLHFVDDYEAARQILDLVLAADPEHVGATILMGDLSVHEEDWDRALLWTERALTIAPDHLDAHEDRVHALMGIQRWSDAVAAATLGLRLETPRYDRARLRLRLDRARCLLELGEFPDAESDLAFVVAHDANQRLVAAARALRAESMLTQERWEEARAEAVDALAAEPSGWAQAVLTAAAWESAFRLGESRPKPVPTEFQMEMLQWNHRVAWVERLLALGLRPVAEQKTRRRAALQRRQFGHLIRF